MRAARREETKHFIAKVSAIYAARVVLDKSLCTAFAYQFCFLCRSGGRPNLGIDPLRFCEEPHCVCTCIAPLNGALLKPEGSLGICFAMIPWSTSDVVVSIFGVFYRATLFAVLVSRRSFVFAIRPRRYQRVSTSAMMLLGCV